MMVKKSVLLMSSLAIGLIFGSGGNAVRNKPMVDEGQRRLYECNGIPPKAKEKLHTAALKQMNQTRQREVLRQLQKENADRNAQRLRDYLLKVETKK